MYRGEIVERVPNDHITLKLATGETKRIEWKDVKRDSVSEEADDEDAPASTPRHRADRAKESEDWPHVRLAGPGDLSLERGSGHRFEFVCRAPCGIAVEPGAGYRVVGSGLRSSGTFELRNDTTVHAKLGSTGGFVGGIVMLGLGGSAVIGGFVLITTAKTSESYVTAYGTTEARNVTSTAKTVGVATLAIGALLLIVGGALLGTNSSSVQLLGERESSRAGSSGFALTPTGFVF
jgi:hypothetical protein